MREMPSEPPSHSSPCHSSPGCSTSSSARLVEGAEISRFEGNSDPQNRGDHSPQRPENLSPRKPRTPARPRDRPRSAPAIFSTPPIKSASPPSPAKLSAAAAPPRKPATRSTNNSKTSPPPSKAPSTKASAASASPPSKERTDEVLGVFHDVSPPRPSARTRSISESQIPQRHLPPQRRRSRHLPARIHDWSTAQNPLRLADRIRHHRQHLARRHRGLLPALLLPRPTPSSPSRAISPPPK